jgi:hypothetical protein
MTDERDPDGFPGCILLLPWPLSAIVALVVAGVLLAVWPVGLLVEFIGDDNADSERGYGRDSG